jgi:hypothetical protein
MGVKWSSGWIYSSFLWQKCLWLNYSCIVTYSRWLNISCNTPIFLFAYIVSYFERYSLWFIRRQNWSWGSSCYRAPCNRYLSLVK